MTHQHPKRLQKKKRLAAKEKAKIKQNTKAKLKQNTTRFQRPQATGKTHAVGGQLESVDLNTVIPSTRDSDREKYETEKNSINYVESLAHILPYELVYRRLETQDFTPLDSMKIDGVVGVQAVIDDDGIERMYYVKRVPTTPGMSCFVLFSPEADNSSVKILFRGTADIEGGIRDLETLGTCPGGDSFKLNEDAIMDALNHVIGYKVQQGCHSVCLDDAGHSLGGADAQLCAELILRKIAADPDDPILSAIKELRIMHANAAGTSDNINRSAEESLEKILANCDKKGTPTIKVKNLLLQVGGDMVQQSGECYLLWKIVRTIVLRFDMLERSNNPIEPHSALFANRSEEVGTSFTFTLLDTNIPEHRATIQEMLSFKWPKIIAIKDSCVQALEMLREYRKYAPHIEKFINIFTDNLEKVFATSLIQPYIPMPSRNFDNLTDVFSNVSEEYLEAVRKMMESTKTGLDSVSEVVPMIDKAKKNMQFIAEVTSCLHSYYEYQANLSPWERKACQMGLALILIASVLMMCPTLAPGLMSVKSAATMNILCSKLIKEGCYLCKIGLRRHKNLKANSIVFENLDKYAQSLPKHEKDEVYNVRRALYFGLDTAKQDIKTHLARMTDNIRELKDLVGKAISGKISRYEFTLQAHDKVNDLLKPIQAITKASKNPEASKFLSSAQSLLEKTKSASPQTVVTAVQNFLNSAKNIIPAQIAVAERIVPKDRLQQVAESLYASVDVMSTELKSDQELESNKLPTGEEFTLPTTIPGLVTIMAGLSGMMANISGFEEVCETGKKMFEMVRPGAEHTKSQKAR